jgi:hypothetical protein
MNAALLLQLWETGSAHPAMRTALMHQAASDGADRTELLSRTPGQRDHGLLVWRERLFGEVMACVADCERCGERSEFDLRRADLAASETYAVPERVVVEVAGHRVEVRLPRLSDIHAAKGDADALFSVCIVNAKKKNRVVRADQLPSEVRELVEEHLRTMDPLLDLQLMLHCPACSCDWSAPFDVASYCWAEVERWAHRMLHTVHRMASAYGWSESEVLALSAARRERYLQLIAS